MGEDQLYLAKADINFNKIELVQKEFYVYVTNQLAQLTADSAKVLQLHSIIRSEAKLPKIKNSQGFRDMLIVKQSLTLLKMGHFNNIQTIIFSIQSVIRLKFTAISLIEMIFIENRMHKR
jgi:hypothetical protein